MLPLPSVEDIARKLVICRRKHDSVSISCLYPCLIKTGLDAHSFTGNALIEALVESGNIHKAQLVFDKLIFPALQSWNALIEGYNTLHKSEFALTLYKKLQGAVSFQLTGHTYVGLLKACKKLKDIEGILVIHSEVAERGLLKTDPFLGSTLVDLYFKFGMLEKAQQVFDDLPLKDVVTWTAVIGGYGDHDLCEKALEYFDLMQKEGFSPNEVTFICSLKACGSIGSEDTGHKIHSDLEKKGFLTSDNNVGISLVDMYAKCGSLCASKKVLETIQSRNTVMWNALIAGYTDNGLSYEALACLEQMNLEGVLPDAATFVLSLKACGSIMIGDLGKGLHAEVERRGLFAVNANVGNTLVDMYSKCGLIDFAQEVFDKLASKDVVSWTALIEGYTEQGCGKEAINLFKKMQIEGVSPNHVTAICCLRACGIAQDLERGEDLHAYIQKHRLLDVDVAVGNSLIYMYAKCEQVVKSQDVFDKIMKRNVVTWNTLLSGYYENGHGEKVLECFRQMKYECMLPNTLTFLCCLKACSLLGSIEDCIVLHTDIEKQGLLEDPVVGNLVVDTYFKCGFLFEALQVFQRLPARDSVSWSILISGYCEQGHCHKAFELVKQMQIEGHSPDTAAIISILKVCILIGDVELGRDIHVDIERLGLIEMDILIGSTLIDMYGKWGVTRKAQEVFERMPVRNEVSWNALILGLCAHGHVVEANQYLEHMEQEGVSPDPVTFIGSLVACASMEALDKGEELHVEIERRKILDQEPAVGSVLVDFYAKCGLLTMAHQVFEKLLWKSVAAHNALIAGYVEQRDVEAAFCCFAQMQSRGVLPDDTTYVWILKACLNSGSLERGQELLADIERRGLSKTEVIGTAMVNMYAEFGLLRRAQDIFDDLPAKHLVLWNVLIAGYTRHGYSEKALMCLEQMEANNVSPDAVTMLCGLKACGQIGARSKGQMLHTDIEKFGLLASNHFVGNMLLGMYANCGSLPKAQQLFDVLDHRDVVSWNVMMLAYVKHGLGEEALKLVNYMQGQGVSASTVTYICSLKACGSSGAWDLADEIHAEIERQGILKTEHCVGSTLVDLYAKQGVLVKAQDVCNKLPYRSVVPWTALMRGYALLGESRTVFKTFERMIGEGVKPDSVAFVVVLSSCCRSGMLNESLTYFDSMTEQYGLSPSFEQHCCVVSLLSCIGEVERAMELMKEQPMCSNFHLWGTVLKGCAKVGKASLGSLAFKHAVP